MINKAKAKPEKGTLFSIESLTWRTGGRKGSVPSGKGRRTKQTVGAGLWELAREMNGQHSPIAKTSSLSLSLPLCIFSYFSSRTFIWWAVQEQGKLSIFSGEEEGSDLSMFSTDRREYVAVIEEYLFMLLSEIVLEHTGGGCENVFPPPVTGSALHSKKHNMLVPAKSSFRPAFVLNILCQSSCN
ncbi:hypothetical protein NC651_040251 [Populus alba x Populus x berolinensis]|nr:hypothetical protein NC651_040251 [Populus alba x Populus x berolinensis]